MQQYDSLPPELRAWIAGASLPWSPCSCLRIWRKARREGLTPAQTLARLARSEQRALLRAGLSARAMTAPHATNRR